MADDPMTNQEVLAALKRLAVAVARVEIHLEQAADERAELRQMLRDLVSPKAARPDASNALADAINRGYGAQFLCGELLAWCVSAPSTPERRAVRGAVATLLGQVDVDEADAQRLGRALQRCGRLFVRVGVRGGSAVWRVAQGDSGGPIPQSPARRA